MDKLIVDDSTAEVEPLVDRTRALLAAHLPLSLRAVAEGHLDPFRAQLVAEESVLADRQTCAAVEEVVFPRAVECTPGELHRLVRRTLDELAPEMVRARAARAARSGS